MSAQWRRKRFQAASSVAVTRSSTEKDRAPRTFWTNREAPDQLDPLEHRFRPASPSHRRCLSGTGNEWTTGSAFDTLERYG
jgi:hypothetical protein